MILIDVRMPTNCDDCVCCDDGWRCGVTHSLLTNEAYKERLDNCPLIEIKELKDEKFDLFTDCKKEKNHD